MGNRRMISKTVTQTHRFLRLPLEAQALYFHLIQNCDDDGVAEAFPILRMIGANEDNLGLLVIKQFVKPLNDEMVYSRVFKKTGLGTTNEHVYQFKTQQDKRMML